MAKDNKKEASSQIKFCNDLMTRLKKDFDSNVDKESSWFGIKNHTQMQNDIIRLRRELNVLNKLLDTQY